MVTPSRVASVPSTRKGALNDSSVSRSAVSQEDLPDGGFEGWCAVLGSFIAQFNGYGYGVAFGVFQDFYLREFLPHENSSAISWIGSLNTFLVTALGPISGPLHDKGYFYPLFIGGAVLQSISLFMLSLVKPGNYYQVFLAQGLANGLGQGLLYVSSLGAVSQHFSKRRTLALSVVVSGVPFGGVVHTIMLNKLLNGPLGFATATRIHAGFLSALLFISSLLVRPRYHPENRAETIDSWKAMKECLTELPSLLLISGFFLFQVVFLYPFFYFQVDSIRHGLGASFSFYTLVILNAASFCGRVSGGFITRYVGVIELAALSSFASSALLLSTMALKTVTSFVVFGILYGIAAGINVSMMTPSMILLAKDSSEHGVRMGTSLAILGCGSLIGSPISGALLTSRYLWWVPAVFCTVVALIAGILFLLIRVLLARRSGTGASEQTTSQLTEDP